MEVENYSTPFARFRFKATELGAANRRPGQQTDTPHRTSFTTTQVFDGTDNPAAVAVMEALIGAGHER